MEHIEPMVVCQKCECGSSNAICGCYCHKEVSHTPPPHNDLIEKSAQDNLKTYKKTFEDLASHDKGHSPQGTSWEEEFEILNRNCDGAYGTGEFPPEVKLFIRSLLTSQENRIRAEEARHCEGLLLQSRTKTIEEVKRILEDEISVAHTTTSGKTSRLTSAYNRICALTRFEGCE